MSFELTVLGSAGSHTGPGQACSGYLLTDDDTKVLMECGNGSTMQLQQICDYRELDAIVISHRHVDHCVDLIGMFYAMLSLPGDHQRLDLYANPDVLDFLATLVSGDSALDFNQVFHHIPIDAGDRFDVGRFSFECFRALHPVPSVSLRISAHGRVLAYSSDTAGDAELLKTAADADTFLCEATWQGDPADWPAEMHLTARQAGQYATDAGARRLILTHVLSSLDRGASLEEARETFHGDLLLAEQLRTYRI